MYPKLHSQLTVIRKDPRLCCMPSMFVSLRFSHVTRPHLHTEQLESDEPTLLCSKGPFRGFPTRMVYLCYISCLRHTILAGNPRFYLTMIRVLQGEFPLSLTTTGCIHPQLLIRDKPKFPCSTEQLEAPLSFSYYYNPLLHKGYFTIHLKHTFSPLPL